MFVNVLCVALCHRQAYILNNYSLFGNGIDHTEKGYGVLFAFNHIICHTLLSIQQLLLRSYACITNFDHLVTCIAHLCVFMLLFVVYVQMARILWIYYLSKIPEFLDTIIMALKQNFRQITFLHVYHHLTIFIIWWVVVYYAPGISLVFKFLAYNISLYRILLHQHVVVYWGYQYMIHAVHIVPCVRRW